MNIKRSDYSTKLSPLSRILYGLIGLFLILIDVVIVYAMYGTAVWVSEVLSAPYVVTLLLLILIALFTGGIVLIVFIGGILGIYGALVG